MFGLKVGTKLALSVSKIWNIIQSALSRFRSLNSVKNKTNLGFGLKRIKNIS